MDGVYLNKYERSLLLQTNDGILEFDNVKDFDRDTFGVYAKSLKKKGLVTLFETDEDGPEIISLTTLGFKAVQALLKK